MKKIFTRNINHDAKCAPRDVNVLQSQIQTYLQEVVFWDNHTTED